MSSLADKIQEIVKKEEIINSNDINFIQVQELIEEMKKLGIDQKPSYTLPLADTIGKGYYASLNRSQPNK